MALALRRVGDIQVELSRYSEAEKAYRESIATLEALNVTFPIISLFRHELGHSRQKLGKLLDRTLRFREAEEEFRRAGEVFANLSNTHPTDGEYQQDLSGVVHSLGQMFSRIGRHEEARASLQRAIELMEHLVADVPNQYSLLHRHGLLRDLAGTYNSLGLAYQDAGLDDDAEAMFRRVVSRMNEIVKHNAANADDRVVLGGALHNLGQVLTRRRKPAEACQLFREAIEHEQSALALDPRKTNAREFLRNHHHALAEALIELGDHSGAARAAREIARMAPASSMNATVAASIMAFCSERAGQDAGLSITARGEAAKLYLQEARTTLKVAAELSKDQPISLDGLAWFLSSCQQASLRDPALALELAESAVRKEPENKAYLATLGLAHYRMGHWSEALQAIKKEIRIGKGADTADWFVLAMAYQRLGDKDQAIRCYRRADAQRKKGQEPSERRDEMDRFHAEAVALLGLADLPADVFARP